MAYAPSGGQSSTPPVPPKSPDVIQYEADLQKALALSKVSEHAVSKEQTELERAMALSMETARLEELRRKGYASSDASYQEVLRRSSRDGGGHLQGRPRPQRPPRPASMTRQDPQQQDAAPNLIDLELEFDPMATGQQQQQLTSSSSYQEDLLQIFASDAQPTAQQGAAAATSRDASITTGVSMAGNVDSRQPPPSAPWTSFSDITNPVKTKSLPNSPELSQRKTAAQPGMTQSNAREGVAVLQHSASGSDLLRYFHSQPQQRAFSTSPSSAFMKYAPGVKTPDSSQSLSWNQTHRKLLPSQLSSKPQISHFSSSAPPSGIVVPVPLRPHANISTVNVNKPSRTIPQSSASILSSSAPSKSFPHKWESFGSPSMNVPQSSSSSVIKSSSSSNLHQVFNDNSRTSSTKQAFVWTDRSNEAPSIKVTPMQDSRRSQVTDVPDSAMDDILDDILREFDILEVDRPPRAPKPPSPLQDANMVRLSCSESNIAGNPVSWMDFDPLHADQTPSATGSDETAPDDGSLPPSYEESQRSQVGVPPPAYAESESLTRGSPSPLPLYGHDDKLVKRPLSPPARPPPPKSPTRSKSKTPPPRPKSPRPYSVGGSPRHSAKDGGEGAKKRAATWRPMSFTVASTENVKADRVFFGDGLFDLAEEKDEEATVFCESIANFRSHYESSNPTTNPGHVVSAMFQHPYSTGFERSVELVVYSNISSTPVSFTCDVSTSVQHIIGQAVYMLTNELNDLAGDAYMLKVLGLAEYLSNDTLIGDYEYVQECIKFEKDVKFMLQHRDDINRELRRTLEDDTNDIMVTNFSHLFDRPITTAVSTHGIQVLLDAFHSECKKLSDSLTDTSVSAHPNKVIQIVKAICATLATVETNDITRITDEMKSATNFSLNDAIKNLTTAVQHLREMYCKAFDTGHAHTPKSALPSKPITAMTDSLIIRIASVHRLHLQWKSKYEHFTLSCGLFYGGKPLFRQLTTKTAKIKTSFFDKICFDQVFTFGVPVSKLPRETRLCFTLYGTCVSSDNKQPARKPLGWVTVALFNFKSVMMSGSHWLGLWPENKASPIGTCASNLLHANSVILQVDFPSYGVEVNFPTVAMSKSPRTVTFEDLDKETQNKLNAIFRRDSISRLQEHECHFIWSNRHYLHNLPHALPWVLRSNESWDWSKLSELYSLLNSWTPLEPVEALLLLHPQYADCHVRAMAVEWIQCLSDDELCDCLTQLVQALKYENYHDSALARFLLERALTSVRIAHYFYWHLRDSLNDQQFSQRFQMVLGALLSTCGHALREQFRQQDDFMKQLSDVANVVKKHKDSVRQVILHRHLEPVTKKYPKVLRLPLSPSLDIGKMKIKSCSYFTSFTVPLRLVFENVDPFGEEITVMYKAGEDLRQDMLTLQMIRLMDKLWLKEGMDLKMITFRCMATGQNSGLVELVPDSETLRKIQVERGVTGSFKDRPLADWLQKYNPTEAEYQKTVDNFIYSCAGYCVATYVLGIGDRHNDNIMVKTTGHVFHIDFGKFLGNAQMFGSFKRDRTPFVLTPDMAYVINGGDKPSSRFHDFVDICCQAFNIIRAHANLFFSLFCLMLNSGIAELSNEEDIKYVHNALKPSASNAEATAVFTRLIEASLGAKSTQINFFIHNLAQMRFSGSSAESGILSFSPKIYSRDMDGKIESATVFGYQKRYNPDKHYMYIVKVNRVGEKEPTFIFRKFSEFHELDDKLSEMFPRIRLPTLSSTHTLGRTHIKQVAEKRKIEIEKWLEEVFNMAPEISECDLVYTFFHPMLRDERDVDMISMVKPKESALPTSQNRKTGQIGGQVKLSLHYKNNALVIMVMHVKDLIPPTDSGPPDPYVKLYLLPDPAKATKRKTKVARKTLNPTYNEMLIYNVPLHDVRKRILQISVWNCDYLKENDFMGSVNVPLEHLNLTHETVEWYRLGAYLRVA